MSNPNVTALSAIALVLILLPSCLDSAQANPIMTKTEDHHHSHQHGYHRSFDDVERWAKKFDDPARDQWQKPNEVIEKLHIATTDKVADIGAGTGYFSLRIAEKYPAATVYAADVEDNMVAFLSKQTKKRALLNHMPIKVSTHEPALPEKVNLVLFVDTCHHIDDRTDYFVALKSRLLPNGRVAIIDFTADSPEGPPREHRIAPAELKTEMREAGYVLAQEISLLPNQYFLIFKLDGRN